MDFRRMMVDIPREMAASRAALSAAGVCLLLIRGGSIQGRDALC